MSDKGAQDIGWKAHTAPVQATRADCFNNALIEPLKLVGRDVELHIN